MELYNIITCDLLHLAFFFNLTVMSSRVIHVVACVSPSFLFINNIPLYGYTTFSLSIHQLVDIWVVSSFCYYG